MSQRQSNIELLRIVCMFFILIVHADGASLGLPVIMTYLDLDNFSTVSKEIVECISIIGVNGFVLISGYFGIRISWQGLIRLISLCIFYSVLTYSVVSLIFPEKFSLDGLINSLIIFPKNDLWFVPAYIILYVTSPLINWIINKITTQYLWIFLLSLIIINIGFGWYKGMSFNPYGYNSLQLIFIYVIGRSMKLYNWEAYLKLSTWIYVYLFSTLLIFISTFYMVSREAFAYNSPMVILSAVSFFMIFTKFHFTSRIINWTATSTFAVYLIHKSPSVWLYMRDAIVYMNTNWSTINFVVGVSVFCVLIFIGSVIIDKITFVPLFNFFSKRETKL